MRRTVLLLLLATAACRDPHEGVVASASPEATQAGVEILNAGGNAIDAAIAVGFALAVTEPAMSGLGAGIQMIIQAPGREPYVINGTSLAPAATPTAIGNPDSVLQGHRATTIPMTVATLDHALRTHGSGNISWARAMAPAIRQARDGFVVGEFRARVFARHQADLAASPTARALFLKPDGTAPTVGDTVRQPVLARTLARIAQDGAETFYRGSMALEIAGDMAANGGWITLEDLEAVRGPRELAAIQSSYRGFDIASLGSPAAGWVVLQALNVLEQSPADELAPGASVRPDRLVEALLIAHTSRRDNPIIELPNLRIEAGRRIAKSEARRLLEALRSRFGGGPARPAEPSDSAGGGETTHYTVVDGAGMIVSVTTSINGYFGAQVATPTLGFLYNDYMREFELARPDHPFAIGPGRMPYSSMSASIVSRAGVPVLGLGSPGSARIISAVTQVIQLWVDGEGKIQEAVAMPRYHVQPPGSLYIEDPAAVTAAFALESKFGLRLRQPPSDLVTNGRNAYFGGVHAVALEDGRWVGAADPRRDGTVGRASGRFTITR